MKPGRKRRLEPKVRSLVWRELESPLPNIKIWGAVGIKGGFLYHVYEQADVFSAKVTVNMDSGWYINLGSKFEKRKDAETACEEHRLRSITDGTYPGR